MAEEDLDRLIESWAAQRAPELIARAQADALDAARTRLQARLVDALLHAADTRLAGAARPDPLPEKRDEPEPARARASTDSVLWVYGVVGGSSWEPAATGGVDGHPVVLHRHAGVGALVSRVPRDQFGEEALKARLEDLDGLEALARAHEAVLEAAMGSGAVVPFRLCTVYSSPERLAAMLEREGPVLTSALRRLERTEEWGVKAFLRAPAHAAAAEDPTAAAASGTDYLSRKREQRDAVDAGREASDAVVMGIHARLAERAAAAVLSRPQDRRLSGRDAEMVLNAAYLVPCEGVDAFRSVVEQLARPHEPEGLELELTGPWPPYHFVEAPES
jgi:hypothetical protein